MKNKILIVGAMACLSAVAVAQSNSSDKTPGQQGTTPGTVHGQASGKRMHEPVAATNGSSAGNGQARVATGDVNGDGRADAVASKASSQSGQSDRESSQPSVSEAGVTKASPSGSHPVATGDLNGDGKSDVAATAGSTNGKGTRDAASGQASGKRQHEPVTVMKSRDMATPK